jgi:hypothetical protein
MLSQVLQQQPRLHSGKGGDPISVTNGIDKGNIPIRDVARAAFMERVKREVGNYLEEGALSDASDEVEVERVRTFENNLKAAQTVGEIFKACRDASHDYPTTVGAIVRALIPAGILREDEFDATPSMYEFDT